MERRVTLSIVILFGIPALAIKTYRSDYAYSRKTDAFFKLHTESSTYVQAHNVCLIEGGRLVFISSEKDVEYVHGMLKQFPDIPGQVWTSKNRPNYERELEGGLGSMENKFTTAIICDTINRQGNVETLSCEEKLPFICKLNAKDAPYDSQCGVFSSGYEYWASTGSCYKVSQIRYSWNQAFDDCEALGSHLVVINSELERQVMENITWSSRGKYYGHRRTDYFFAGLRAEKTLDGSPRVFKTVFGETLKAAGFDEWSAHEPNNMWDREYCGSIHVIDGRYNDLDCSKEYPYICEKEVGIKQLSHNKLNQP